MKLEIDITKNGNELKDEWIRISAKEDTNLGKYAIVDKTFAAGNSISNIFRHFYVFPSTAVKKRRYFLAKFWKRNQ